MPLERSICDTTSAGARRSFDDEDAQRHASPAGGTPRLGTGITYPTGHRAAHPGKDSRQRRIKACDTDAVATSELSVLRLPQPHDPSVQLEHTAQRRATLAQDARYRVGRPTRADPGNARRPRSSLPDTGRTLDRRRAATTGHCSGSICGASRSTAAVVLRAEVCGDGGWRIVLMLRSGAVLVTRRRRNISAGVWRMRQIVTTSSPTA